MSGEPNGEPDQRLADQSRALLETRFPGKIQFGSAGQCWPRVGRKYDKGYGRVGNKRSHRLVFEMLQGDIPPGVLIRHTCDNPPCCNPFHLLKGDEKANAGDAVARGRNVRGESHGGAKIVEEDVRYVRGNPDGLSCAELARRIGVVPSTICDIRNFKTWRSVE
jgi:hypothetical protein